MLTGGKIIEVLNGCLYVKRKGKRSYHKRLLPYAIEEGDDLKVEIIEDGKKDTGIELMCGFV